MNDAIDSTAANPASSGELFIIEGPDGVGKSTIAHGIAAGLTSRGYSVEQMSFPGKQEGTLGGLVYEIHHDPRALQVPPSPSALQTLHVAAHLDLIDREIRPAIRDGRMVILDRFWWSTWVYGVHAGLRRETVDRLLQFEAYYWGEIQPLILFLIQLPAPHRPSDDIKSHAALNDLYAELSAREATQTTILDNQGAADTTITTAVARIEEAIRAKRLRSPAKANVSTASGPSTP